MTSIKIKLMVSGKGMEGSLVYQVIHNRIVRQIDSGYKVWISEWDELAEMVVLEKADSARRRLLLAVARRIKTDREQLFQIVASLDRQGIYTTDDVLVRFRAWEYAGSFERFMEEVIVHLKELGKVRTSETYTMAYRNFMCFRKGVDIRLDEIDSDLMELYESHLKGRGLSLNTVSFYMRILRATYNRAVAKGLTRQCYPFRYVYTGVEKTLKRALPLKFIKCIKQLDLSLHPSLDFARDMFLFSFYTRGMSFVDIAYLKKKDLQNGVLTYRRRKTGQLLFIKWERCMQEIVDKYTLPYSDYLLPIIKEKADERKQYQNALHAVNHNLKKVSLQACLPIRLTMYVARHSWASVAKSKHIPLAVISEGMGHSSENTTQIYLASLDNAVIDHANRLILRDL